MYYKTQNEQEYMLLVNFAKTKGIDILYRVDVYESEFPLLKFDGVKLNVWSEGITKEFVSLSEFIKAMEGYKPSIKIAGQPVVFNKGMIEVGDVAISNELVREIVKNLID